MISARDVLFGSPALASQRALFFLGFDPGPLDGSPGKRTAAAQVAFRAAGLAATLEDAVTAAVGGDDAKAALYRVNERQAEQRKYPWFTYTCPWEKRPTGARVQRPGDAPGAGAPLGQVADADGYGRPACRGLTIPGTVAVSASGTETERILRVVARTEGAMRDSATGDDFVMDNGGARMRQRGFSGAYDAGNTWDWAQASWGPMHETLGTRDLQPGLAEWAKGPDYASVFLANGYALNAHGDPCWERSLYPLSDAEVRSDRFSSVMQDACRTASFREVADARGAARVAAAYAVADEAGLDLRGERIKCLVVSAHVNGGGHGLRSYIDRMKSKAYPGAVREFARAWLEARGTVTRGGALLPGKKTALWRVNYSLQTPWVQDDPVAGW